MLADLAGPGRCARWSPSGSPRVRRWASAATSAPRSSQRVGSFSAREVQHFGAPSLITRETNDVQQVQMLVLMGFTMMVSAPIMMVGAIVMAMREDVGLSWLIVVTVPVLGGLIGFIVSRMVPSFRVMQEQDRRGQPAAARADHRHPRGACVRPRGARDRALRAGQRGPDAGRRSGPVAGRPAMFPVVMLVANVASVAVLWFGGHRVESGEMQVGALTAYLSYLMQIIMSVMMGTFMMMMIPQVGGVRRPDHGGARHRVERRAARPTRSPTVSERGTLVLDDVDLRLPRRGRAGAARTSTSRRVPARPSRSSARPAPASRRWSTSCRGSST